MLTRTGDTQEQYGEFEISRTMSIPEEANGWSITLSLLTESETVSEARNRQDIELRRMAAYFSRDPLSIALLAFG